MIFFAILGAVLVAAGLIGLFHCIREGYRMRRSPLPPEQVRARLRSLVTVNVAAVALAALGLANLTLYFVLR